MKLNPLAQITVNPHSPIIIVRPSEKSIEATTVSLFVETIMVRRFVRLQCARNVFHHEMVLISLKKHIKVSSNMSQSTINYRNVINTRYFTINASPKRPVSNTIVTTSEQHCLILSHEEQFHDSLIDDKITTKENSTILCPNNPYCTILQ